MESFGNSGSCRRLRRESSGLPTRIPNTNPDAMATGALLRKSRRESGSFCGEESCIVTPRPRVSWECAAHYSLGRRALATMGRRHLCHPDGSAILSIPTSPPPLSFRRVREEESGAGPGCLEFSQVLCPSPSCTPRMTGASAPLCPVIGMKVNSLWGVSKGGHRPLWPGPGEPPRKTPWGGWMGRDP